MSSEESSEEGSEGRGRGFGPRGNRLQRRDFLYVSLRYSTLLEFKMPIILYHMFSFLNI